MKIQFVKYDLDFLKCSSVWLRDSEIKWLTMTPDISEEDQRRWFKGLEKRKDYLIWGIKADDQPIGAVGLKHIDERKGEAEYFGYIGVREMWGKGIGVQMMQFAHEIALKKGIQTIYLHVVKSNMRAVALYKKMKYEIVSEDEKLVTMERKMV